MTPEEIRAEKQLVEERHGAWTAHNLRLADGIYTRGPGATASAWRSRRYLQIAADFGATPLEKMRVLDLGCLEGVHAAEFAARGAAALGVEIREASVEKARFAARALGLERLEFRQDDVRDLSAARDGRFDVVVCSGILYHLEAPDAARLVRTLRSMTARVLIVDTRIALRPETSVQLDGRAYHGSIYREHGADTSAEERAGSAWASIDNETSFWFTRSSLVNLLRHSGFVSVYECHAPTLKNHAADRITLAALPSEPAQPVLSPTQGLDDRDLPE